MIPRNPKVGNLKEEGVVDMLDELDSGHCIQQLVTLARAGSAECKKRN